VGAATRVAGADALVRQTARTDAFPESSFLDLSLGSQAPLNRFNESSRAAGPPGQRRVSFAATPPAVAPPLPLAISIALVGSGREGAMSLPDRRLDELSVLGAERAAALCRAHRIRVTFLVPGAHAERHAALVRRLALDHEIGLFGFDPVRAGPDDPLRARERLASATGIEARWYGPPFHAPVSNVWLETAGLHRVPAAGVIRIGPMLLAVETVLRLPKPLASTLLSRALERLAASATGGDPTRATSRRLLHVPLLAGSFARAAAGDLPRGLRAGAEPDLGMLARAASPGVGIGPAAAF
jgi:hypothetical protein